MDGALWFFIRHTQLNQRNQIDLSTYVSPLVIPIPIGNTAKHTSIATTTTSDGAAALPPHVSNEASRHWITQS